MIPSDLRPAVLSAPTRQRWKGLFGVLSGGFACYFGEQLSFLAKTQDAGALGRSSRTRMPRGGTRAVEIRARSAGQGTRDSSVGRSPGSLRRATPLPSRRNEVAGRTGSHRQHPAVWTVPSGGERR